MTPLQWACKEGHVDIVKDLMSHYKAKTASAQSRLNSMKPINSPTHSVNTSANSSLSGMFSLGTKELNIDHKSKAGFTSLHYACLHGHQEIVTLLLSTGASVNATDFEQKTVKNIEILTK